MSDVTLKRNITLGRTSRTLRFLFKILQFILCVFSVSCCMWHYGKHFVTGLSNSLKVFSLKLSVWKEKIKKKKNPASTVLPFLVISFMGFMKVWLYGWSCEMRKARFRVDHFCFVVMGSLKDNLSISLFEFICPSDNVGASRYLMALWSVWVRSQWRGNKFSDPRHELTGNQWKLGTSISSGDTATLFVSQQDRWFYTKTSTWIRRTVSYFKYGSPYVLQVSGLVGKLHQMVRAHSEKGSASNIL